MTQLSSQPVTAFELHQEIKRRKNMVDEAISDLMTSITKKLESENEYIKAKAKARIQSVATDSDRREADHNAYVSKATDTERFNAALQKEMLKYQYKVLDARMSQLSATQTDAKVVMQEMRFAQTGPTEF